MTKKESQVDQFDYSISYEKIKNLFEQSATERNKFKAKMLDYAIKEERRGQTVTISKEKTQFYQYYWKIVDEEVPELYENPGKVGKNNTWIRFNPENIEGKIIYKMKKGKIEWQTESIKLPETPEKFEKVSFKQKEALRTDAPIIEDFSKTKNHRKEIKDSVKEVKKLHKMAKSSCSSD